MSKIDFKIHTSSSSLNTLVDTIIGFRQIYFVYLSNLRNKTLAQIRSDVYFKKYSLQEVILSGVLDDYGCLKPAGMRKLREHYGLISNI
jgi:hypothetical protein